jgi:hypothetical protein
MTLKESLEVVARLGEGYILEGAGDELTANELLKWLGSFQPQSLPMPVQLVLPDGHNAGVINEIGPQGEVRADVPLYRIEPRILRMPHAESAWQMQADA